MKKIKSVIELARYRSGDTVYTIHFTHCTKAKHRQNRRYYNELFDQLLNNDIVVKEIDIILVVRSRDGEFLYQDKSNIWYKEKLLFDTIQAARNEKRKILASVYGWLKRNS